MQLFRFMAGFAITYLNRCSNRHIKITCWAEYSYRGISRILRCWWGSS